jgi:hypothetical protein
MFGNVPEKLSAHDRAQKVAFPQLLSDPVTQQISIAKKMLHPVSYWTCGRLLFPDKALAFHKQLKGRDAVAADLRGTLQQFNLEFVENQVESLLIEGNTAVEQTLFAIKGTPKAGGESFVVYIRYEKSPTGWDSIREMIQPATD